MHAMSASVGICTCLDAPPASSTRAPQVRAQRVFAVYRRGWSRSVGGGASRRAPGHLCVCATCMTGRFTAVARQQGSAARKIRHQPRPEHASPAARTRCVAAPAPWTDGRTWALLLPPQGINSFACANTFQSPLMLLATSNRWEGATRVSAARSGLRVGQRGEDTDESKCRSAAPRTSPPKRVAHMHARQRWGHERRCVAVPAVGRAAQVGGGAGLRDDAAGGQRARRAQPAGAHHRAGRVLRRALVAGVASGRAWSRSGRGLRPGGGLVEGEHTCSALGGCGSRLQAAGTSVFTSLPREASELFATCATDGLLKLWDVRVCR